MIVAGLQMDIAWEHPKENFLRVRKMVGAIWEGRGTRVEAKGVNDGPEGRRVIDSGHPDLIVLPEMFATGFSMNAEEMAAHAEDIREFLSTLAKDFSVHVLGGYPEPSDPLPANACSIFNPGGEEILHFQKLHPFSLASEGKHYKKGESLQTAVVDGARITPLICYDLRFPEPFRAAALGTDLFCVIANWPAKRRGAWSALLKARAIENQAYLLGVNRVGMGGGEPHSGDSALIGPQGEQMAVAPVRGSEGVVLGKVNPGEVTGLRRRFSFLKDRRPDLYQDLEEGGSS